MATSQLSDEELFTELKRSGMMPGPVTENTRPVYLKKLKKLREDQKPRLGKVRVITNNNNLAILLPQSGESRPYSGYVTPRRGGRQSPPREAVKKSPLLGFSSDDSDADIGLGAKGGRRERGSIPHPELSPAQRGCPTSADGEADGRKAPGWWGARRPHSSPGLDSKEEEGGELVTGCRTVNGGRFSPNRDYSDSDEEEPEKEEPQSRRSRRSIGKQARNNGMDPPEQHSRPACERNVFPRHRGAARKTHPTDPDRTEEFTRKTNNHLGSNYSPEASRACLSNNLPTRVSYSNHLSSNHSSPHLSYSSNKKQASGPEEELLQQFKSEVSPNGGFSAHYLSMFLLIAACLFFLLLGLSYMRVKGTAGMSRDEIIRSTEELSSVEAGGKNLLMNTLHKLHDKLAKTAGDHICGDTDDGRISVQEATEYLKGLGPEYENQFNNSVLWILQSGKDVGIKCSGDLDSGLNVTDVKYLESTRPQMSFVCRIKRAIVTVAPKLSLLLLCVAILLGVIRYMRYHWSKQEENTRLMYEVAVKIVDVLKSHKEACKENKDLEPQIALPHLRDTLIPPRDRKKMAKIWDQAVDFLLANEPRLHSERQDIAGECVLFLKWLPPVSCDRVSVMPSKVWQGQAFHLDRRNSPPNSLTPCLKIRNMFDPVVEIGDHWHLAIQEAILEKCSDNEGIVHIAVDKNSREGCVYVKCLSPEYAGNAFKALHGSWFDGKLVTVKYLRLDRYHHRFPQALSCNTPLKPSNKHMNSMSHLSLRTGTLNSQSSL
ncbi:inner nuclear membrane protein Man1 isoform 2-T2 [Pelodytes ibericus]